MYSRKWMSLSHTASNFQAPTEVRSLRRSKQMYKNNNAAERQQENIAQTLYHGKKCVKCMQSV